MSNEPDFVSERPGEHEDCPNHFWIEKRRFDVEYEEAANGVWHASTQVHRSGNGRLYHPDHAPYDAPLVDVETISETGPLPREACEALKSVVEAMDSEGT